MTINLNRVARVVLTQEGADALHSNDWEGSDALRQMMSAQDFAAHSAKHPLYVHFAGEVYEAPLWALLRDFGPHMPSRPACPFALFQNNDIEIEEEE